MRSAATELTNTAYETWVENKVEPSGKSVSAYLHALIVADIEGTSSTPDRPSDWLICPFGCGQRFPNTGDGCSDMRVHVPHCPLAYKHTPLYHGPTYNR